MKKNVSALTSSLIVSALILFFLFKPAFQTPDSVLFSKHEDGLKNYFNFSYYLKYDGGIRHDGINYPYGDHLQYINSHPLYVQIVKFVDAKIYPVSSYGVFILNLTMVISLLLAIPFLFLILRKFALPRWYAALMAVTLLFLSPQFLRIHGHFEMVYAFFIPMYWYFLIRWREGKKRWLWSVLLVAGGLVGGFTSAYYASFYAILLLGVLFVELWNQRKNLKNYWKTGLSLFILAIFPLLVVKGVVSATDWVSDRPNNPYGFDVYHAEFLSVFLPLVSPLKMLIGNVVDMDFEWEGRAYVGLPATLLAVSVFITAWFNLFSNKKVRFRMYRPSKQMEVYFYAAILILLFSMCIPFKYGFGFLLEIIPPVKQFRALGRFAFIFYYVFTVYAAWFIYRLFRFLKQKKQPLPATLILIFALSYWAIDAGTNTRLSTNGIFNTNDRLEVSNEKYLTRFKEAGVNPEEFQAILFLPFSSTCGDKLLFENGMEAFGYAMQCAHHTGLPLVQSFSPRLSFTQALSSIQLLANPAIQKTRLDDMNEKPLLLVSSNEKMNEQERWLFSNAEVFWQNEEITLSKIQLDVFHESHENWLKKTESIIPNLNQHETIYTDTEISSVVYLNFDEQKEQLTFSGEGAFFMKRGKAELLNQIIPHNFLPGEYELSFWLYLDTRRYNMPRAILTVTDGTGKTIHEKQLNTRSVNDVYQQWIRVSETIELQPEYQISLNIRRHFVTVDDILLKPLHSNVYIKKPGGLSLFNNFPIGE
ncbi:ArnT family glycosyltransferase [Mariniphaga sp.]|uniref:ArnT family glycosyltransferase n=1 Tax=Mariniphaga sp. TaxID=1954475 RepID=UPI00356816E4